MLFVPDGSILRNYEFLHYVNVYTLLSLSPLYAQAFFLDTLKLCPFLTVNSFARDICTWQ